MASFNGARASGPRTEGGQYGAARSVCRISRADTADTCDAPTATRTGTDDVHAHLGDAGTELGRRGHRDLAAFSGLFSCRLHRSSLRRRTWNPRTRSHSRPREHDHEQVARFGRDRIPDASCPARCGIHAELRRRTSSADLRRRVVDLRSSRDPRPVAGRGAGHDVAGHPGPPAISPICPSWPESGSSASMSTWVSTRSSPRRAEWNWTRAPPSGLPERPAGWTRSGQRASPQGSPSPTRGSSDTGRTTPASGAVRLVLTRAGAPKTVGGVASELPTERTTSATR